jgi:pyruvate kinase
VTVVAVGAEYTTWEGGRDAATGAVTIGLSYDKLCHDVKPGGRILMSDGTISIEVGCIGMLCWVVLPARTIPS